MTASKFEETISLLLERQFQLDKTRDIDSIIECVMRVYNSLHPDDEKPPQKHVQRSPKAPKEGNYYSKFSSICLKKADDRQSWIPEEGFSFTKPAKMKGKQQEAHDAIVALGLDAPLPAEVRSLKQLIDYISSKKANLSRMTIASWIWNFFMSPAQHEKVKENISFITPSPKDDPPKDDPPSVHEEEKSEEASSPPPQSAPQAKVSAQAPVAPAPVVVKEPEIKPPIIVSEAEERKLEKRKLVRKKINDRFARQT
jgi:hypothetical protein